MRKNKENGESRRPGVYCHKASGKYVVRISFEGRQYYLGLYNTIEEAVNIRKAAEKATQGDFLTWYRKKYPAIWVRMQNKENWESGPSGVSYRKSYDRYKAYISFEGRIYFLGYHDTMEEAVNTGKIAEKATQGDFSTWYRKKYPAIWTRMQNKENVSPGPPGVSYRKSSGRYGAYISFEGRQYCLGYHDTIEEAVTARETAEKQKASPGDFLTWYRKKYPAIWTRMQNKENGKSEPPGVSYNKSSGRYKAYVSFEGRIYFLGYHDTMEEAVTARETAEKQKASPGDFLTWYRKEYKEDEESRHPGVYCQPSGRYSAFIGFKGKNYYLGRHDTIEGAVNIRKAAEKATQGDFLMWYQKKYPATWTRMQNKENGESGPPGVYYRKSIGKYSAYIGFKGRQYYLGYHDTIEGAVNIRKAAEKAAKGDFLTWYWKEYKENRKPEPTGVFHHKSIGKYSAYIGFKGKNYYLGAYNTMEEAVTARETAEKQKASPGDFLTWYRKEYPAAWTRRQNKEVEKELEEEIGQVHGSLKVIEVLGQKKYYGKIRTFIRCECQVCNRLSDIPLYQVKSGQTAVCAICGGKNLSVSANKPPGVSYHKSTGKYRAYIYFKRRNYSLGLYNTIEGAVNAHETAKKAMYGDFLMWYKKEYPKTWSRMKNKENGESGYPSVYYNKSTGKYIAYIMFKGKQYYLGLYDTMEGALRIGETAKGAARVDFLMWYRKEYPAIWSRMKKRMEALQEGNNK